MTRTRVASGSRLASGLGFALLSAVSFGLSGALAAPAARGRLEPGRDRAGPGRARGALVVLPFGLVALRGRWDAVRRNAGLISRYGVLAVAGAQFCYFSAVQHMQVGPAILIEYTAPAAVVVWMWLRHGQRPGALTLVGAGLAALGLVLVLDLLSGADLSPAGVLWALAAMVGAATYFIDLRRRGQRPAADGARGRRTGRRRRRARRCPALVGLLPMRTATAERRVRRPGRLVGPAAASSAWSPPRFPTPPASPAIRRLGSRLASFVALLEVVASVLFAWLLLDELPRPVQLLGGLLILAGVVVVKLGERGSPHRSSAVRAAHERYACPAV